MDVPASFAEALSLQIAGANAAAVLVWVPGLVFLLFSRAARPYRSLGIVFLTLLVVILFSGQRRGDRIAGVYPIVWAAGAAFWDQLRGRWRTPARWALPVLLLASGALAVPVALPLLPPPAAVRYLAALGQDPEIEAADAGHGIPLYLMGRLEWERVAAEVVTALRALPPEERERAVVLAPHWGYASVVDYYGRDRGLPPVVSPHNAYYFWRRDAAGRDVVISLAIESDVLARYFAETRQIGMFRCEYCASWRPDLPIFVSYGPTRPLEELLTDWRYFGIEPAPDLRR